MVPVEELDLVRQGRDDGIVPGEVGFRQSRGMLPYGNPIVIGNRLEKSRIESVEIAAQNDVWFEMSNLFGDDIDKAGRICAGVFWRRNAVVAAPAQLQRHMIRPDVHDLVAFGS